jgi:Flp pilus assembly protein TadB
MSKARQLARAERQRAVTEQTAVRKAERAKAAAARARRERRVLAWRRVRLWQHGPGFQRRRETWGAMATLVLLSMLVAYLVTRSWGAVVGTALVFVVGSPVLVLLFFDRSRK